MRRGCRSVSFPSLFFFFGQPLLPPVLETLISNSTNSGFLTPFMWMRHKFVLRMRPCITPAEDGVPRPWSVKERGTKMVWGFCVLSSPIYYKSPSCERDSTHRIMLTESVVRIFSSVLRHRVSPVLRHCNPASCTPETVSWSRWQPHETCSDIIDMSIWVTLGGCSKQKICRMPVAVRSQTMPRRGHCGLRP